MKNTLSFIISLLYFFTAQFTVHAFAMHPSSSSVHDHHMHHGEQEQDHEGHDMSLCLEQSIGVFSFESNDTIQYDHDLILPIFSHQTLDQHRIDTFFYSLHDPGRGEDSSFSKFLTNDLYGHGVIMHC